MNRTDWNRVPDVAGEPNFDNILTVLQGGVPTRPTLFEFFRNGRVDGRLIGDRLNDCPEEKRGRLWQIYSFYGGGYDYATFGVPGFAFPTDEVEKLQTRSLNAGAVIADRATFDAYPWPDVAAVDYGILDDVAPDVPAGMKLVVNGPGGVLENVIQLVGYDNLCYLIVDDEPLVFDIFEAVGSRMVEHYRRAVEHASVGAIISNDDWGFKSQTMLSPADMRRFVFPWHKRIVATAHAAGRPAILHSCGNLSAVMDDVIDDMQFDGKHSYEDIIQPVEEAYEQYHGRIAILGGIDMDFVVRAEPERIYERSKAMLERASGRGGYALGTGNSVPEYVPDDHFFALIRAALDAR